MFSKDEIHAQCCYFVRDPPPQSMSWGKEREAEVQLCLKTGRWAITREPMEKARCCTLLVQE